MGLIPGQGRSPGGGHGSPLQGSCLENPTDRGAWRAAAHVVAELDTAEHARRDNRRHGESLFTVITCVARG